MYTIMCASIEYNKHGGDWTYALTCELQIKHLVTLHVLQARWEA